MADTVRRATWHTIASFLVVVAFISVTVFTLRYGWRVERNAEDYCAFGSGEVNDATTLYVTQGNIADTVSLPIP